MTPQDAPASAGPLHASAEFISARLGMIFPKGRFQHEVLPAPLTPKVLGQLCANRAPFVGLAWLGLRPRDSSGRALETTIRWGVYLVASNPKHRPRLLGDTVGAGLAQMVHAAIIGLQGWIGGGAGDRGIGGISIAEVETTDGSAWEKADMACAALVIEIRSSFTAATEDQLKTLAGSWTFDGETTVASDTFLGNRE